MAMTSRAKIGRNKHQELLSNRVRELESKIIYIQTTKEDMLLALPQWKEARVHKCFEWVGAGGRAPCVNDLVSALGNAEEALFLFETANNPVAKAYFHSKGAMAI